MLQVIIGNVTESSSSVNYWYLQTLCMCSCVLHISWSPSGYTCTIRLSATAATACQSINSSKLISIFGTQNDNPPRRVKRAIDYTSCSTAQRDPGAASESGNCRQQHGARVKENGSYTTCEVCYPTDVLSGGLCPAVCSSCIVCC